MTILPEDKSASFLSSTKTNDNKASGTSTGTGGPETTGIDKKQIFHALRIMIESAFGIAGSSITNDIQGKQTKYASKL
jgi:hypothetical protein